MVQIQINRDESFINRLDKALQANVSLSSWENFKLTYQAELTTMPTAFIGLQSLEYLPNMKFLPHQINTAQRAIENMNGRAILADEVGLGKTIEAGLILKEYMVRGLVKKALILVPASLVSQWESELNEKFFIPAIAYRKNVAWEQYDIIISSIDTAKRSPHREEILKIAYDFILVDEAHKLKNHRTINYSFVRSLNKKFCLLLTATPIQNKLIEIFNLVSILKPGHLGNYETFVDRYGKKQNDEMDHYLKRLIQKVMIRNTRKETIMNDVKRNVKTIWLDFTDDEYSVYKSLEDSAHSLPVFSKITFLRELCSSREACYLSLKKLTAHKKDEIMSSITNQIEQLPHHIKAKKVIEILEKIGDEKLIIFTEYRATQYYLQAYLAEHNVSSVPFKGGFKSGKKDWMRQLFQGDIQVLIATEAGSEGINLQFCQHLINYDLPWNPMRLEQRIGRIHRYGQANDVHIYNFAIKETIEEHIMKLLYDKINLFEQVIGELDHILSELNISNLETEVEKIYSESVSQGEATIKIDNLASIIKNHYDYKVSKGI